MSDAPQPLKIRTNDGIVYDVSPDVAQQMGLTRSWVQLESGNNNRRKDNDDDDNIMPLDRVRSAIYQLVLKWFQALKTEGNADADKEEVQLHREILKRILNEAGATDSTLFELIIAADYLNIESLLHAGTQHVADVINGCATVESIRERFNIIYNGEFEDAH